MAGGFVSNAARRIPVSLLKFGAKMDGVTDDTAAWVKAAAWSNANKKTVMIPTGYTVYKGGDFVGDFVSFSGAGMPTPNAAFTALEGGTVVRGKMVFKNKVVHLTNFGVDMGVANNPVAGDALVVSNAAGEWAHVQNVAGMGRDPADVAHGILIEGYASLTGGNVVGVHTYYGVAVKARSANFGNMTAMRNSVAGVIIKHDSEYSGAGKAVYGDILVIGNGATDYGVSVLCMNTGAAALEMRDVTIGNVMYSGVEYGCAVQGDKQGAGAVVIDAITFGDISGSHTVNGFLTQVQGGAQIYTVKHGDLIVSPSGVNAGVADYEAGFNILTGKTVANLAGASTRLNNAVYVAASIYNYVSTGIALSVDYSAAFAAVSFNGSYAHVSGIQNFESQGASPIVRQGMYSPGTPAAGRYVAGEFVRYTGAAKDANNMTLLGWTRLVTGSAHVMGTDWAMCHVSHVSPAV